MKRTVKERIAEWIAAAIVNIAITVIVGGVAVFIIYNLTGSNRMTPYEILGVERTASKKEITKVFRKMAMLSHPDKFPGDKEKVAEFIVIKKAYDLLKNAKKRARYDKTGEIEPEPEIDSLAIGIILANFKTVILDKEGIVTNYIIDVNAKLEEENQTLIEQSMVATIVIKKLRVLRKFFKVNKGQENILLDSLESDILDLEVSQKIIHDQRQVLKRAFQLLQTYEFTGRDELPTNFDDVTIEGDVRISGETNFIDSMKNDIADAIGYSLEETTKKDESK